MKYSTIREILTDAERRFGNEDAVRYKAGKNVIKAKTYSELKTDSERITDVIRTLGEQRKHIAVIGATSVSYTHLRAHET